MARTSPKTRTAGPTMVSQAPATSRDRDVLGAWLTIGGPAVLVLGLVLAKIFRPGLRMF